MLILILINVQYLQIVVLLRFERSKTLLLINAI